MAVVIKKVIVALAFAYIVSKIFQQSLIVLWTLIVSSIVVYGSYKSCFVSLTGKNPVTGRIAVLGIIAFLPYYIAVLILMIGGRLISLIKGWKSFDEIFTGVYLGDYYSSFMADKKWNGVVDVTNELPRFGNSKHYVNVPAWDGCPPPVEGIQQAVDFIMSTDKPILIHCAYELLISTNIRF